MLQLCKNASYWRRKESVMLETVRNKLNDLRNGSYVTYSLLAVTLSMYVILSVSGGSEDIGTLIQYGAKVNELIYLGDWWRIITPMFLHIGFMHLVLNSLILYFLGSELEMFIGHLRFFILYFLSGILGNLASFALTNSLSAGASTAIFGMFASTLVLTKLYPYHTGIQLLSRNYLTLIVLNILFGFFSTGVDNAGHLGGLLGGYLIMYAMSSKNAVNNPQNKRITYALIYVLALVSFFLIGYFRVEWLYGGKGIFN